MLGSDRARDANLALLAMALLGLAGELGARWLGLQGWDDRLMVAGTVPALAAVAFDSVASLWRREVGLDVIALLSIAGAFALGEYVTAAVIGVMLAGGRALEDMAAARARREMSALLARVPRTASRYEDGRIEIVPLKRIVPGDRLLVRAGETVPVDGMVDAGTAVVDESTLTGEPMPVRHGP
ncbi:P-type ATPase, partial [Acidisphaera rubrifaciens]